MGSEAADGKGIDAREDIQGGPCHRNGHIRDPRELSRRILGPCEMNTPTKDQDWAPSLFDGRNAFGNR